MKPHDRSLGSNAAAGVPEGGDAAAQPSLRGRFQTMIARAADAGFEQPERLWRLTPAEIELELRAFAARERRRIERMDEGAWLAGRYAAIAWHAPRRYPSRPDGVLHPRAPMTDAEMKRVALGLARRNPPPGRED